MFIAVYVSPINHILGQRPLDAVQWVPVLMAPVLLVGAEEARKALLRRSLRRSAT